MAKPLKYPVSALVVLHDGQGYILLIERADRPGFWQSVTGSIEQGESTEQTAWREAWEETGIRLSDRQPCNWHRGSAYEVYHHQQHRYPEGVFENREHVFSAEIPRNTPVRLAEDEHTIYGWFDVAGAAEKAFSPSNRAAILDLHKHMQWIRPQRPSENFQMASKADKFSEQRRKRKSRNGCPSAGHCAPNQQQRTFLQRNDQLDAPDYERPGNAGTNRGHPDGATD